MSPPPITPRPPRPSQRPLVLFVVVAVVLVVAVAGGVWLLNRGGGNAAQSTPTTTAPKVDLSTLDVGSYDVTPREFPGPPTPEDARNIEAFNLAQWIVPPPDIIPTLTYVNGLPVSNPAMAATAVSGNGTKVIQPVLEKYGMISGFLMQGFPKPVKEFVKKPEGSTVNIMVTSFPSAEKAGQAAAEMDATDFAVNPANVAVPIPGYPDAHAHYQPGNSHDCSDHGSKGHGRIHRLGGYGVKHGRPSGSGRADGSSTPKCHSWTKPSAIRTQRSPCCRSTRTTC